MLRLLLAQTFGRRARRMLVYLLGFGLIGAIAADRLAALRAPLPDRIEDLRDSGRLRQAAQLAFEAIEEGEGDPRSLELLLTIEAQLAAEAAFGSTAGRAVWSRPPQPLFAPGELEAHLLALPPPQNAVARMWLHQDPDDETLTIVRKASAESVPIARSLVRWLQSRELTEEAISWTLAIIEGGGDVGADVELLCHIFFANGRWGLLGDTVERYPDQVPLWAKQVLAEHQGDWFGVWRYSIQYYFSRSLGAWSLAVISVFGWVWLSWRLLGSGSRASRLVLAGLALGALAIVLTGGSIILSDDFLGFREDGTFLGDLFYNVIGIGLREEVCKLLCFLPLLPFLKGRRLDGLVAGGLVGLGFAMIENANYVSDYGATAAITRFLTSSFLHMMLTGLVGAALAESKGKPGEAVRVFVQVVVVHGVFDFLLGSPSVAGYGMFAMTVFVLIGRRFLDSMVPIHGWGSGLALLEIVALTLVGVSLAAWIALSYQLGLILGLFAMLTGVLGEAVIFALFAQRLPRVGR